MQVCTAHDDDDVPPKSLRAATLVVKKEPFLLLQLLQLVMLMMRMIAWVSVAANPTSFSATFSFGSLSLSPLSSQNFLYAFLSCLHCHIYDSFSIHCLIRSQSATVRCSWLCCSRFCSLQWKAIVWRVKTLAFTMSIECGKYKLQCSTYV